MGGVLGGCDNGSVPPPVVPRVKVQRVVMSTFSPQVTLTGEVQARVQTELSFRVSGKIVERRAEVGDSVKAGQVLARLDPQDQRNNVNWAEAALLAEQARVRQSSADFRRQALLLPKGYTSRSEYDRALAVQQGAESSLKAAQARLANARDLLSYTQLVSEVDGVITTRYAEIGQVVQATTPIFNLARDSGRDAVFHVYEALFNQVIDPLTSVEVVLLDNPQVRATGKIREVTPTVAERTGTLQVKVALDEVPKDMRLGAVVSATRATSSSHSMVLLASALSSLPGEAAVWRVDAEGRAQLQPVRVVRYLNERMVIDQGLEVGQQVVVAGGQLLYPGQTVKIIEVVEPISTGPQR